MDFQFTLTSYDQTIEKNVPRKMEVIEKFRCVSELVGKERIVWHYDPILLSNLFDIDYDENSPLLCSKLQGDDTIKDR
ncbi:MAG: DUF1848 family protein [Treponema sp.]|nr:DUF1848 family protein [Treponema sp.]